MCVCGEEDGSGGVWGSWVEEEEEEEKDKKKEGGGAEELIHFKRLMFSPFCPFLLPFTRHQTLMSADKFCSRVKGIVHPELKNSPICCNSTLPVEAPVMLSHVLKANKKNNRR